MKDKRDPDYRIPVIHCDICGAQVHSGDKVTLQGDNTVVHTECLCNFIKEQSQEWEEHCRDRGFDEMDHRQELDYQFEQNFIDEETRAAQSTEEIF